MEKQVKKMSTKALNRKKELMGTKYITNEGYEVTVIDYQNNRNVTISFDNGYITTAELTCITNGRIKNPYHPSVYGVGYLGEGNAKVSENGKRTKVYTCWMSMIKRCYDEKFHEKNPSYIGCKVNESWHNFNTFAKWYKENYYEVKSGETMALDKDILIKGNKIYGPNTCVFVPQTINTLFIKREVARGELPIGVSYKSNNKNKYVARYMNTITKKKEFLGVYETVEDAFNKYKEHKETYIKQIADLYKEEIPSKLYDGMYKYQVEIND